MGTLLVKGALSYGWNTFRARPWLFVQAGILLLLINLGVSLVQSVFEAGAELGDGAVVAIVGLASAAFGMAVSFFVSMGETAFFLKAHDDVQKAALKDLWHPKPFWNFVGASILAGIAIILGFIALIIPGIILGILFMFVGYLVIDQDLKPIDALKRSWELTKGNRWKLFFLSLALIGINILGLLALVVGLLVSVPVSFLAVTHAYRTLSGKAPETVEDTVE
ncbi:MAG TPA: DUF975 family protein [Candidatus Paceibacterota bacterium]